MIDFEFVIVFYKKRFFMKLVIAKFGGTSMADATIAKKSVQVLSTRPEIKVCVISATAGTTKSLMLMGEKAAGHQNWIEDFEAFKIRHIDFISNINKEQVSPVEVYCQRVQEILQGMMLLKEASLSALDDLVSHGELISSLLFAEALRMTGANVQWVDAREIVKTTSDFGRALPHLDLLKINSAQFIAPYLKDYVLVTQGYIGSDLNGRTTTLGKEGSDYSTALFAEALGADEIQIWKDVQGVMTTDPKLVSNAQTIEEISFDEVSELTRFGAKVIHPDTFLPAQRAKIPVYVGYSQNALMKGTRIISDPSTRVPVRAVTLKKDQKWLTIQEARGQNSPLFILNILQVLNQYKVIPTIMNTSENRLGFIIDKTFPISEDILRELSMLGVTSLKEAELVAVIGLDISQNASLQAKLLSTIDESTLILTSSGASENSLCFLVEKNLATGIVQKIHQMCWE